VIAHERDQQIVLGSITALEQEALQLQAKFPRRLIAMRRFPS
jgi:hypothetical protein